MKRRYVSPSKDSIFCSSFLVPSVTATSAWVSPRVKRADPWALGRYSTSDQIGRISFTLRPSTRSPLSTISRRTSACSTFSKYSRALGRPASAIPRPPGLVDPERLSVLTEHRLERLRPDLLLVDGQGLDHLGRGGVSDPGLEGRIRPGCGIEGPARLGRPGHELLLHPGEPLALLLTEGESLEHLLLADLLAARLDHEDRVLGAGEDELQRRGSHLGIRRVGDELAAREGHTNGAQGPVEREA